MPVNRDKLIEALQKLLRSAKMAKGEIDQMAEFSKNFNLVTRGLSPHAHLLEIQVKNMEVLSSKYIDAARKFSGLLENVAEAAKIELDALQNDAPPGVPDPKQN